jgi:hypothetical protein
MKTWTFLLAAALLPLSAHAAKRAGLRDRFWAEWDGFDPEAYVMMKEAKDLMGQLQGDASIARPDASGELEKKAKEKIGEEILDWAADINPAVKPIKSASDLAMQGTQAWLDWNFRAKVNRLYLEYRKGLQQSGDPKAAVDAANRWLDDQLQVAANNMTLKALQTMRDNRGLLLAQVIKAHKDFHPEAYQGKDIGKALGKGQPAKPAAEVAGLTAEVRQAVLDCICDCSSTANKSMVGVYYDPKPVDASPSCADPSNGPCVNRGYGCWRHKPSSGGDCVEGCYRKNKVPVGALSP